MGIMSEKSPALWIGCGAPSEEEDQRPGKRTEPNLWLRAFVFMAKETTLYTHPNNYGGQLEYCSCGESSKKPRAW